jgi:hypothetical protein
MLASRPTQLRLSSPEHSIPSMEAGCLRNLAHIHASDGCSVGSGETFFAGEDSALQPLRRQLLHKTDALRCDCQRAAIFWGQVQTALIAHPIDALVIFYPNSVASLATI